MGCCYSRGLVLENPLIPVCQIVQEGKGVARISHASQAFIHFPNGFRFTPCAKDILPTAPALLEYSFNEPSGDGFPESKPSHGPADIRRFQFLARLGECFARQQDIRLLCVRLTDSPIQDRVSQLTPPQPLVGEILTYTQRLLEIQACHPICWRINAVRALFRLC